MSRNLGLGLATLFWWMIVGVFLYPVLASIFFSLYAHYHFKPTSGQVTESLLKEVTFANEEASYQPIVHYKYSVGKHEYRGDCIYWTPMVDSWSQAAAEYIRSQYPVGARVTVYYDPDDLQSAVLETDVMKYRAFQVFFLFPFVVIGVILAAQIDFGGQERGRRRKKHQPTALWLSRVLPTWFVAHCTSMAILASIGAYHPDRVWMVEIGAAVVAVATLIAVITIYVPALQPKRSQTR